MSDLLRRRIDPQARAGLRLTLMAVGCVLLALLVLPIALLVRDNWSPLNHLDTSVEAAAHRAVLAQSWLLAAARLLTHLGAPLLIDAATVVLLVVLYAAGRRRSSAYLLTCVAGAYVLSTAGKLAVDRARPIFDDAVSTARGTSFPSGHATGSAAFYAALAIVLIPLVRGQWRRLLLAAAVVVPVVVAVTRVLLGVHFPSDVMAGLLLGWGWTAAVTAVFALWQQDEGRPADPTTVGVEPAT
ncbi:MAG: phosphatase PAP2 family protein [Mycobacteriales bacterium]